MKNKLIVFFVIFLFVQVFGYTQDTDFNRFEVQKNYFRLSGNGKSNEYLAIEDTLKKYYSIGQIKNVEALKEVLGDYNDDVYPYLFFMASLLEKEDYSFLYGVVNEAFEAGKDKGNPLLNDVGYYLLFVLNNIKTHYHKDIAIELGEKMIEAYPDFAPAYHFLAIENFPGNFIQSMTYYFSYFKLINNNFYEKNNMSLGITFYIVLSLLVYSLLVTLCIMFKYGKYFYHLFYHNVESVLYFIESADIKKYITFSLLVIILGLAFISLPIFALFILFFVWKKIHFKERIFIIIFMLYIGFLPLIFKVLDGKIWISDLRNEFYTAISLEKAYPIEKNIEKIESLSKNNSNDFLLKFSKALLLKRSGRFDEAMVIYNELLYFLENNKVIDGDFEHAAVLTNMGNILMSERNYDGAKEYYLKAKDYVDYLPHIFFNLGVAYNKSFDLNEGAEFSEIAYKMAPDLVRFWNENYNDHYNRMTKDILLPVRYYENIINSNAHKPSYMSNFSLKYFGFKNYFTFSFIAGFAFLCLLIINYILKIDMGIYDCPICGQPYCNSCKKSFKLKMGVSICNSCFERVSGIKMAPVIVSTIYDIREKKIEAVDKISYFLTALCPGSMQVILNRTRRGLLILFFWINIILLNLYSWDIDLFHFEFLSNQKEAWTVRVLSVLFLSLIYYLSFKDLSDLAKSIKFELNEKELLESEEKGEEKANDFGDFLL